MMICLFNDREGERSQKQRTSAVVKHADGVANPVIIWYMEQILGPLLWGERVAFKSRSFTSFVDDTVHQ